MKVEDLKALEILDSRGNPTIKVYAKVGGVWADFSVPSGASTGVHEALELRDGGKPFNGLGVNKAVNNVETTIKNAVVNKDFVSIAQLDQAMIELDGTENKSKLGANAILGVSAAVLRADAKSNGVPLYHYLKVIFENKKYIKKKYEREDYILPELFFNIINGGAHAENNIDIQESMIVPKATTLEKRVQIGAEVYHSLKSVIKSKKLSTGLGDEGGFAPNLESNTKAIELILEGIERAGYIPGKDVSLALDIAASELFDSEKDNKYILNSESIGLSSVQLASLYKEWITNYPIMSIEDGLAQDDWEGWQAMTERIGSQVQLIGDDLFVTNPNRISEGIERKAANAVLIKVNQIGTISETFEAIKLATSHGYKCMISHRSGETADDFIADLVVATGVGQIKAGAPARGERTAKYNRLIEIEKEINLK